MSSLTEVDKQYLERILDIGDGYVLGFTDATFAQFFNQHQMNIHGPDYRVYGTSKAKKMRAFWEREPDGIVAPIVRELIDLSEARREMSGHQLDHTLVQRCRDIVGRISGDDAVVQKTAAAALLQEEFKIPNIAKLPIEAGVSDIVQERIRESQNCFSVGAHLSAIVMCGSVLEAVLLGAARESPKEFNQSKATPYRDGKPRPFHDWSLSQLIDVAYSIGLLKPDVHECSLWLRDFRNYIHPYQQMSSGFKPDEYTAKVCLQVLKAALADIAGER